MAVRVEAVYEHGVLKPLHPLDLNENELVVLTITHSPGVLGPSRSDQAYIQALRDALQDAGPAPGLDEVRRRLSKIPGTLTADFIAEREER